MAPDEPCSHSAAGLESDTAGRSSRNKAPFEISPAPRTGKTYIGEHRRSASYIAAARLRLDAASPIRKSE